MSPRTEFALFLSALGFLTRLPVPPWVGWGPGRLAVASRYFVLAGAAIGAVGGMIFWLASLLLPTALAAGLALAASTWLTGALHEDGLADCADGLGARDRARILEIMRDSRTGAYGVLALIFSAGLRWSALTLLGPCAGALALVLGGGIGRMAMVPATAYWRYVREDGSGDDIADGAGVPEIAIAAGTALVLALIGGWAGLLALIIAGGLCAVFLVRVAARIGGYTGDVMGASAQIGEIAVLIVLAGAWA
ncbi:MAG: adenosylcobinamide-GDP ribazoletransferase [Paracoccaceae bacterium]|nr:adenosylcobinamide-GDP ribazoletransferase [Paracoccaceae bacterium]